MIKPDSKFEAICNQAASLPETERAAYLDQACGEDRALRQRVEAQLNTGQSSGDTTVTQRLPGGALAPTLPREEQPGARFDRYKLLQQIGEGGMGTVWMAEQVEPVRRQVALKVIRPGMDSKQILARFEAERQALALMDHPNIAKVLDAGATPNGRPYFVMELVKGVPITKFCDEHQLPIPERLELFTQVCHAIQHAHQKGIIHRDIKPSNVMVALYDGRPVPKVIDFGVAKATGQTLTERTLFTEFGAVIGTPEYMSPEQAEMNQLDIDTRSDIYSLGVLLYELLTGSTPLSRDTLRQAAFDEILRRIREEEAPKPSTRLSQSRDKLPTISARRKLEPAQLTRLLQGDLDWIVLKTLEKDRTRRYETANGLAMDIKRHLANEPVVACPPSAAYRFRKMIRRNKAAFVSAGAVLFSLVAALTVTVWALVLEHNALQKAMPAALAEGYMRERLIKANRADSWWRKNPPANEMQRLRALGDHAELVMDLVQLAAFLQRQGRLDEAEMLLTSSVEVRRNFPGIGAGNISDGLQSLAEVQIQAARYAEAEQALLQAYELHSRGIKESSEELLPGCLKLITLYQKWNKPSQQAQWEHKLASMLPPGISDPAEAYPRLLGWWRGEGNLLDSAGHFDGLVTNGLSYAAGRVGGSFLFTSDLNGVQIPNPPSPDKFSLAAWVRFDSLDSPASWPGLQYLVFRKNSRSDGFEAFALCKQRDDSTNRFAADRLCCELTSRHGFNSEIRSTTHIKPGVFYHVVATFDGTWLRLYVNGVEEASAYHPVPLDYGSKPMFLGGSGENWLGLLRGALDEVAFYNGALSDGQVSVLFRRGITAK